MVNRNMSRSNIRLSNPKLKRIVITLKNCSRTRSRVRSLTLQRKCTRRQPSLKRNQSCCYRWTNRRKITCYQVTYRATPEHLQRRETRTGLQSTSSKIVAQINWRRHWWFRSSRKSKTAVTWTSWPASSTLWTKKSPPGSHQNRRPSNSTTYRTRTTSDASRRSGSCRRSDVRVTDRLQRTKCFNYSHKLSSGSRN